MKMTGEYVLAASRADVWAALNDPEVLKECIPGCETIEKTSDTEMNATVKMKVGPVSAKFKGKVTLSDLNPPTSYTISGEGSGGAAGFAKGGARVTLSDAPQGGTVLSYDVDAQVGGKIAQIGQRLIDQTAKKLADEFFAAFANRVGVSPAGDGEAAADADTAADGAAAPTPQALNTPIAAEATPAATAPEPAATATPAPQASATTAPAASTGPAAAPQPPRAAPTSSAPRQTGMSATRWAAVVLLVILVLVLVSYVTR